MSSPEAKVAIRHGKTPFRRASVAIRQKGCRTPKEAAMQLLANPKRPHYDPVMVTKLNNPRYESWRAFLPKDTALTDAS